MFLLIFKGLQKNTCIFFFLKKIDDYSEDLLGLFSYQEHFLKKPQKQRNNLKEVKKYSEFREVKDIQFQVLVLFYKLMRPLQYLQGLVLNSL